MKAYFVGALFSVAERRFNQSLADRLRRRLRSLEIVLPQEFKTPSGGLETEADFHSIFRQCANAVEEADLLLAILDGPDVDSGTAWEVGYAFAQKKPVFAIRTDGRPGQQDGLNLMLRQSVEFIDATQLGDDLDAIADLVAVRVGALEPATEMGLAGRL